MSKNYNYSGEVKDDLVAPSGGVVAGLVYVIGGQVWVAQTSADEGELFTGKNDGNWTLPAASHASNQAIALFGPVFWDAANLRCTNVAAGNTLIGAATSAKVSTATEVDVSLWPRPPAQDISDPPAATAATNTTPYGFAQAQANAIVTWIRDADVALKAAGIIS